MKNIWFLTMKCKMLQKCLFRRKNQLNFGICLHTLFNQWLWVIWVSIMNHQQDIFIALKDIHSAIRFNGQMSMDISIVARLKEKGYSLYYYAIYTFFSSPFQSYCSKNGIRRAVRKIKANFMILCHWHMLAPTKC